MKKCLFVIVGSVLVSGCAAPPVSKSYYPPASSGYSSSYNPYKKGYEQVSGQLDQAEVKADKFEAELGELEQLEGRYKKPNNPSYDNIPDGTATGIYKRILIE